MTLPADVRAAAAAPAAALPLPAPAVLLVGRYRWAVRDTGPPAQGGAPPLLLLPGPADDGTVWAAVAPALAAGRRLLVLDLPGTGESGGPVPPAAVTAADTLAGLLDALGVPQVDLAVHDVAAAPALALARRHPGRVRRLVLVAAAHPPVGPWWRRWRRGPQVGRDGLLRDLTARGPERAWRALARRPVPTPGAEDPAERTSLEAALVVWGAADRRRPLRVGEDAVRALGTGATLVSLPGHGHEPHLTAPAEVADAVASFLDAGVPGASPALPPAVGRRP